VGGKALNSNSYFFNLSCNTLSVEGEIGVPNSNHVEYFSINPWISISFFSLFSIIVDIELFTLEVLEFRVLTDFVVLRSSEEDKLLAKRSIFVKIKVETNTIAKMSIKVLISLNNQRIG